MKAIGIMLIMIGLMFGVEDGQSLRNNAGEHVLIGATDSTGTSIKWIKVSSEGYLITVPTITSSTAPTLGLGKVTIGASDSAWVEGNTLLSFSIFNDDNTETAYVGLSSSLYVPIYPHSSFSIPSCAVDTLHIKASGAGVDVYIAYTY